MGGGPVLILVVEHWQRDNMEPR